MYKWITLVRYEVDVGLLIAQELLVNALILSNLCEYRQVIIILLTRNSSGDEIANVNFLYDDTVHALKMQ